MPVITATRHEVLTLLYRSQTMHLRLHTASPGDAGNMANEVVGRGYTPQVVTFTDPSTGTPLVNTADVLFVDLPAVTIAAVSIHRASDGAMRAYGMYGAAITVGQGQTFRVPAGTVSVNEI